MKTTALSIGALALAGCFGLGALTAAAKPPEKPQPAAAPAPATAPAPAAAMDAAPAVWTSLKEVKWGPGSPALPPGAKMAVMFGDPAAKGFVSLRAQMPPGYKIPPHFHPTDEHVTVLSGELMLGMGDTLDAKAAKTLKAGGYVTAGANMHHFAMTKKGAVVQIDLEGPFDITYIDPKDDPRKKTP